MGAELAICTFSRPPIGTPRGVSVSPSGLPEAKALAVM